MSDYTERVNALREHADRIETSIELYGPSATRLLVYDLRNAAAAIEELEAEVDKYKTAWAVERENRLGIEEPKRGEWITIQLNNGGSYTGCSCCEAPIPTDTMLDYIPESESKYCYSCGAKMEAQDGSSR